MALHHRRDASGTTGRSLGHFFTQPETHMHTIETTLSQLTLGAAQAFGNITLFPLIARHAGTPDYLVLDEALEGKLGSVTEISEGGHVPELAFDNHAEKRVLLVDGEELIGARQNRVLNISILVPAGTRITIPVSCCEQGRWAYTGARNFDTSDSALFASAKARKMGQVSAAMRATGERRSDQRELWSAIAQKSASLNAYSSTSAMADVYAQQEARLAEIATHFHLEPGQAGALVALDGKVAGIELFDAPDTFAKFFNKLLKSFALDAIDSRTPVNEVPAEEIARAFLERLARASAETFAALGEGEDVRMSGDDVVAGALVADGRVRHLAAFHTAGLEDEPASWRAHKLAARRRASGPR
jgi:hypothetical protein